MKIEQVRIANRPTYCISKVYVNGEYACDIIEDVDRGLDDSMTEAEIRKRKVYAQTAIPTGTYKITMDVQSPKFSKYKFYYDLCKGYLPRLVKVKGFDGVLWHCGSSAASSAGCAIVGENRVVGKVINSQKTFTRIMKQYFLPAKVLGEEITLTITRRYKV